MSEFTAMKSTEGGFTSMKFRVSSPEQCEALQRKLFSMGYSWQGNAEPQKVFQLNAEFIYALEDGRLLWDYCLWTFIQDSFEEDPAQEMNTQSFIDSKQGVTNMSETNSTENKALSMKFHVKSPEESAAVQRKLLDMGYSWFIGVQDVRYTDAPYLFADAHELRLSWLGKRDSGYFYAHSAKEMNVQEFLKEGFEEDVSTQQTPKSSTFAEQLQNTAFDAILDCCKKEAADGKFQCLVFVGEHSQRLISQLNNMGFKATKFTCEMLSISWSE